MKVELNELGTDVEIRWDNLKQSEPLSLLATIGKWGDSLSGSNFYLSMPVDTAKLLQAKLNELLGV